jgi:hypothetical protein
VAEVAFNNARFQTLGCYTGYGCTDDEAVARSDELEDGPWLHGTMAKRRLRLQEAGLIEPVKELTGRVLHRKTSHGVDAQVFHLTEAGYYHYSRWATDRGL